MEHYATADYSRPDDYSLKVLAHTCVLELGVTAISGKQLAK
jgi:hypothetical protein